MTDSSPIGAVAPGMERPSATAERGRREITLGLARFAVETRSRDIPGEVMQRAKKSFLDTLGIAIGGTPERAPSILAARMRSLATVPQSTVLGHGFKCDAANAALVNGVAADIVGWSDISVIQMTHPSVSICPAAWAMGEQVAASGLDVLAAHVIGTEIANKIGAGVKPGLQQRGWHPLAILNTFGAAAAAGRLLGIDVPQMQDALGIAAGEASGMRVAMGTMSKAYGAGRSARDGVRAATLALMGFTGPRDVFEARDGFLQTFGDGASGEGILEELGAPYEFIHPGIALKKYPACTRSHNAIEALFDLRNEHAFAADDVVSIECLVTPAVADYLKYAEPQSALEAKYSMPYCLAVALLDGQLTVASFTDERTRDPEVVSLMQGISMRVWEPYARHGYNPAHAPYGCRIEIRLREGTLLSKQADRGPWEPATPPSWDDIVDKFRTNAEGIVPPDRIARIVALVTRLEAVADFREVMEGL